MARQLLLNGQASSRRGHPAALWLHGTPRLPAVLSHMGKRPDGTPSRKPPAPSTSERAGPSPVTLVTALHAAETLATFHLQQVVQTAGERQVYHLDMAERCEADIEDIKLRLAAKDMTVEKRS
jgi:hypothetical protein